jgi:hypothetical protein
VKIVQFTRGYFSCCYASSRIFDSPTGSLIQDRATHGCKMDGSQRLLHPGQLEARSATPDKLAVRFRSNFTPVVAAAELSLFI